MSKYIIANCPCIVVGECNSFQDSEIFCKDCTDCVLKQIVSRLNNFAEDYGLDAGFYADELLSYLDIQECE